MFSFFVDIRNKITFLLSKRSPSKFVHKIIDFEKSNIPEQNGSHGSEQIGSEESVSSELEELIIQKTDIICTLVGVVSCGKSSLVKYLLEIHFRVDQSSPVWDKIKVSSIQHNSPDVFTLSINGLNGERLIFCDIPGYNGLVSNNSRSLKEMKYDYEVKRMDVCILVTRLDTPDQSLKRKYDECCALTKYVILVHTKSGIRELLEEGKNDIITEFQRTLGISPDRIVFVECGGYERDTDISKNVRGGNYGCEELISKIKELVNENKNDMMNSRTNSSGFKLYGHRIMVNLKDLLQNE